MPPIAWGLAEAIVARPADSVAPIQHGLTVLHRTSRPPDHPWTKSVDAAAPITGLEVRLRAGPCPVVAKGISDILAAVLAPPMSFTTTCIGSLALRTFASSLWPAQFSL